MNGDKRLDGNFAAGILSDVFVPDITTTRAMCANCGTIRALGALPAYGQNMGAVMRCPTCDAVVLRVARPPRRLWVDAIIDPAQTREALIWALEAAALNPEVKEFKTGVLQT